ncbi:hypothetical protein D0A36_15315 [Xanthomonas campestris]|nr:hypothetical protein D0A41_15905 [Xanthomonas campestris]RFF57262.1 hypothetical protein D0A36_15315 [Xanthomonas campestris]
MASWWWLVGDGGCAGWVGLRRRGRPQLRAFACELRIANCGLRVADCGLRIADCGLRIAACACPPARQKTGIATYIFAGHALACFDLWPAPSTCVRAQARSYVVQIG